MRVGSTLKRSTGISPIVLWNRKEQETLFCGAYSLVKGLQTALVMVMVPVSAVAPIARACEKRLALPRQDASIASASVQELPLAVPLCVFPGISCSDGPQSGRTGPQPGDLPSALSGWPRGDLRAQCGALSCKF